MAINQIKNIVNDAIFDALGQSQASSALAAVDTSDFVSFGKKYADVTGFYEQFFGSLVNRIVRTVYFIRSYSAGERGILRDEHEFGAFIQKVYYDMPEAVDNPTWKGFDTVDYNSFTQASPYDVTATVPVSGAIFGEQGTWSIEIVRPVQQVKTAFTSENEMAAFIDGIYVSVRNTFEKQKETIEALAANTGIAEVFYNGRAINLLKTYNDANSTSYTVKQALQTPAFLKWAYMQISWYKTQLRKLSKAYNSEGYATFTPDDKLMFEVNSIFAMAMKAQLESDTYHNDLVSLEGYREIPYWQYAGPVTGTAADRETMSMRLFVDNDGLTGETYTPTQIDGVVAYIHDVEHVAAYFGRQNSWEMYNPRSEVMIHGEKCRKGYAVDEHANALVFYMATTDWTPTEAN